MLAGSATPICGRCVNQSHISRDTSSTTRTGRPSKPPCRSTDVDRSDWYDYPLSGRVPLTLFVAADPECDVVFVRLTGKPDSRTQAKIEAAVYIFTFWKVT
jgi:hypothetical protein